ncbi:hypothetical protein C8R46DRAFT_1104780 [Mycena filopes]|nr:hypothetical protein C8R46DRAFT_1104780 [Mycena filopes]
MEGLTSVSTLLTDLHNVVGSPFIHAIAKTSQELLAGLPNARRNKEECFQLAEGVPQVIYAIIQLHLRSSNGEPLASGIIEDIGRFVQTLQKINTFIGTQQNGRKMIQLCRQREVKRMLKDCQLELDQAAEVFKVHTGLRLSKTILEMKKQGESMQKQLLDLVVNLPDNPISDVSPSELYSHLNGSQISSTSSNMLPAKPKIFYGREAELHHILGLFERSSPRIVILGGGGMGKTSLARAALHHGRAAIRFNHKLFVSAETVATVPDLAVLLGQHLGLKTGLKPIHAVIQALNQQPSLLLVLDNLETLWEPVQSRGEVEEFLSLLADVEHLGLVVTMRGAERPGQVKWTRPFLLPLQPLSDDAAQQTFNDITDDSVSTQEKTQLLRFTANMPLAVNLMAHLVEYEGLQTVLLRWQEEKTAALSVGYGRTSNLDASIAMSCASPRITTGAKELLSLLSVLPDGLSDIELTQLNVTIPDIYSCKSVLLATLLAYKDTHNRLRSLVPIREHIKQSAPPSQHLIHSARRCFHQLLETYRNHNNPLMLGQITANAANLNDILRGGLQPESSELFDTTQHVITTSSFYRPARRSQPALLQYSATQPLDHRLEVLHTIEQLWRPHTLPVEELLAPSILYFHHVHDPTLESKFYLAVGHATLSSQSDPSEALRHLQKALALCRSSDRSGESDALTAIAYVKWCLNDHFGALTTAKEAQSCAHRSRNVWQEVRAFGQIAMCSISMGNYQNGIINICRARETLTMSGISGSYFERRMMMNQADIHIQKSEYMEARDIYAGQLEDLSLMEVDPGFCAVALLNLAYIDGAIGAPESHVRTHLEKAKAMFTSLQMSTEVLYCDVIWANLKLREGLPSTAALFQKYLRSGWMTDTRVVFRCLAALSQSSVRDTNATFTWPVIYLVCASRSRARLVIHKALLCLGEVFLATNDQKTAENLFIAALDGFTSMDIHCSRAECMDHLGDIALTRGDNSQAVELWKASLPLFTRTLQNRAVVEIQDKLARSEGQC